MEKVCQGGDALVGYIGKDRVSVDPGRSTLVVR